MYAVDKMSWCRYTSSQRLKMKVISKYTVVCMENADDFLQSGDYSRFCQQK